MIGRLHISYEQRYCDFLAKPFL